jgi:protein gp37
MGQNSAIEWTETTWNPLTGCDKVSPGCKNCYAERMAHRLRAMGQERYANGFELTLHDHLLEQPLSWRKPQNVFVNSMSDLFHEEVPFEFIRRAFDVMRRASWHRFQVLTKRSQRLLDLSPHIDWPENVWMGVRSNGRTMPFASSTCGRRGPRSGSSHLNPCLARSTPSTCGASTGSSWVASRDQNRGPSPRSGS